MMRSPLEADRRLCQPAAELTGRHSSIKYSGAAPTRQCWISLQFGNCCKAFQISNLQVCQHSDCFVKTFVSRKYYDLVKFIIIICNVIKGLGFKGDVVTVSKRIARNHMLPVGVAEYVTPDSLAKYERIRKVIHVCDQ